MLKYVKKYKVIDLYVDHSVTKESLNVDESLLVNEIDNDMFLENQELWNNNEDVIEDVSEDEWLQNCLTKVGIKKKHAVENNNDRRQSSRNEGMNVEYDREDGSHRDHASNRDDGSNREDGSNRDDGSNKEDGSNSDDDSDSQDNIGTVEEEEDFVDEEVNLEELDSGSNCEYEGNTKKALKMYHKMNKANASNAEGCGTTWKEKFYVGLRFCNSNEIKEMVPQFSSEDGVDDSSSKGIGSSGWVKRKSPVQRKGSKSIKPNLKIPLNALKDQLQKQYEVGISKKENNNPNTTVKIEVEKPDDANRTERKFKRVYVCLGPLKAGFKACKRDLLGLDGCFLSGSTLGDLCVVNMKTKECSCRNWELTRIPYKHAVAAIWDMAGNGEGTAIPESYCHQVHWLSTWKVMYKFKVTDMSKVDKNEAKRPKPGTGMERVQEIEVEGEIISNPIPLILYPK
uniref:SWIM-type domain-containing protein n=1 Tax=Tanacetum cinerariifolium TaxID=118510 RepID=A0A6L2LN51_TANCI|nr:hypothetical protein [Tanacetum cinerariifolium]